MSNPSSDGTQSNPILSAGLAVVALLGVAGVFLPADLLPVAGSDQTPAPAVTPLASDVAGATDQSAPVAADPAGPAAPLLEETPVAPAPSPEPMTQPQAPVVEESPQAAAPAGPVQPPQTPVYPQPYSSTPWGGWQPPNYPQQQQYYPQQPYGGYPQWGTPQQGD